MKRTEERTTRQFREALAEEYARRFPRSKARLERHGAAVLDHTSHAIRWNDPFMPVASRAAGPIVEDLDGHHLVDYWQGHFTNVLGHNPRLIRDALAAALQEGRGLQTGMLHEVEGEVAELLCERTNTETLRLTTSGSLGTFYAVVLARAFTGRELVLKVSGGWHGSQPFGLKGVAPHGESFDHLESEGLSSSIGSEIVLTRFNDVEGLREAFARRGDDIACFLVEPVMGSGGGMAASPEYLAEARRLTERHGALLLCDEIITGFRFRAGDLTSTYGVRPDLLVLGKIVGGGMPVAAVAGRRDVLDLSCRKSGRVKFEGGTFSAHELSLISTRTMVRHLVEHEDEIYPRLSALGDRMREGIARVAAEAGVNIHTAGSGKHAATRGSLVFAHVMREGAAPPDSPDALAAGSHPLIGERLLKSTLLLEDVSTRSGLGAISTAHGEEHLDRTLEGFRAALGRFEDAGLI
jgi:glutamate-1-semialdehyde 2,1-aminomutase